MLCDHIFNIYANLLVVVYQVPSVIQLFADGVVMAVTYSASMTTNSHQLFVVDLQRVLDEFVPFAEREIRLHSKPLQLDDKHLGEFHRAVDLVQQIEIVVLMANGSEGVQDVQAGNILQEFDLDYIIAVNSHQYGQRVDQLIVYFKLKVAIV